MDGTRIFIGGLPRYATKMDIKRFFKGYSRVTQIVLRPTFGFVQFEDYRVVDDVIYERDGKYLLGGRVTVRRANQKPCGSNVYRVIVENLSSQASWEDLKELFLEAGHAPFVEAHCTRQNEGMADFQSRSEMERAIEVLDGTKLKDRRIRLRQACGGRNKRERSCSYDSSSALRSRSDHFYSRSRSASRYRYPEEQHYREVPQQHHSYLCPRSTVCYDNSKSRKRPRVESSRKKNRWSPHRSMSRDNESRSRFRPNPRSRPSSSSSSGSSSSSNSSSSSSSGSSSSSSSSSSYYNDRSRSKKMRREKFSKKSAPIRERPRLHTKLKNKEVSTIE